MNKSRGDRNKDQAAPGERRGTGYLPRLGAAGERAAGYQLPVMINTGPFVREAAGSITQITWS